MDFAGNLDDKQIQDILVAAGERKRKITAVSHGHNAKLLKRAKLHLDKWKKNGIPDIAFVLLQEFKSNIPTLFNLHRITQEPDLPQNNALLIEANVTHSQLSI